MRGLVSCVVVLATASSPAFSQPAPAKPAATLEGATEVTKLTTPSGFIDDAIAVDGDRIAYVVADSSSKAELHVLVLSTKAEQVVDVSQISLHPLAITLVAQRAFVVGEGADGKQVAGMVDLVDRGKQKPAGTVLYKVAPATHITALPGKIAVHRVTTGAASTKHEVEILSLDNGRRLSSRVLELADNVEKKLDFRVNHWSDGYSKAHGLKGGEWDRKEDQRSPDTEATYDFATGKLDKKKIDDLFEQRKRFQALVDSNGAASLDFVRIGWDNKSLQAWRGGKLHKLELDQPLATYDIKSIQGIVLPDAVWIAAKVDPVNQAAVDRKKADTEYLDIFVARPDGTAARKARVPAQGIRHRFGVTPTGFWLVERNQTMERGGKSLTIYKLN
jgi:hypothetical protein